MAKRYLEVGTKLNFKQWKKGAKNFEAQVSAIKQKIVTMGKIAAASFGAAGVAIAALTRSSMKQLDALGKLSDELGISTESLRTYQQAAKLSGTDVTVLQKGLQRLARRVGEARAGFGEGVKGLEILGLAADEFKDKNMDQIFERVVDAIKSQPDAATRAAAAYKLFGRQGQEMMNLILGGSDGLNKMREDLDAFGVTIDRSAAAKVEEANDAMVNLRLVLEGLGNQIAIRISPYITALAESLQDAGKNGDSMGARVANAFKWVQNAIVKVVNTWNLLSAAFHTVESGFYNLVGGIGTGFDHIVRAVKVGTHVMVNTFGFTWQKIKQHGAAALSKMLFDLQTFARDVQWIANLIDEAKGGTGTKYSAEINLGGAAMKATSRKAEIEAGKYMANIMNTPDVWKETTAYGDYADMMFSDADRAAEKAVAAFEKYREGTTGKMVEDWFKKIEVEADKRARKLGESSSVAAAVRAAEESVKAAAPSGPGSFAVINRDLIDVTARVGREQKVRDPQLQETNRLLKQIADGSGGSAGSLAAVTV